MQRQAVILDLDGLIVDSEPLHQKAFNHYLARKQIDYQFGDEEYGRLFVGIPVSENINYLISRFQLESDPKVILAEREAIFEELISDPSNLTAMPGLVQFLQALSSRGTMLAVASGSPRRQVELMLDGLKVTGYFRAVVAGTDVRETKPAPDVYLRALEQLGARRRSSVAIEDSATGIASAKAAGLDVIAIPNRFTRRQDLSNANALVENLSQALALI